MTILGLLMLVLFVWLVVWLVSHLPEGPATPRNVAMWVIIIIIIVWLFNGIGPVGWWNHPYWR